MKINKIISMVTVATLGASLFLGCGSAAISNGQSADSISVVTTIFPEYDWVREIVGDNGNVDITMLLDDGVDLHNYQPTAEDIMKIATCDVFIYVGGESDEWVDDALSEATNENMQVVNLLDVLGTFVKEEEEYDEHVWLSLKNAQILVDAIEQAIATVDGDNAETYAANASVYKEKLDALDEKYQSMVDSASIKTVLFGDRFPFGYLVDDYGLDYYAAFVGCSAETEASFETITFLASKVDELNLDAVFTIENSDQKIAQTIIDNTEEQDAQILTLDSLQSITMDDVNDGVTYLSVMEENLEVLSEGLR